jgi:hypothetical protein
MVEVVEPGFTRKTALFLQLRENRIGTTAFKRSSIVAHVVVVSDTLETPW